ncbi:hypothetical protein [Mycobacterium shigaense]|uniref:Uncharacterized protein n=1 Tax=Mycobacterium shigaense TaxID=722731 RepID=A0A1Z4EGC9_9MYCO|nr:hypothetical protein [Mycobacterium shigaense]MEA1123867.1 hypothetical protein [Mycobacterium shigaense]PRI16715.1 hypothetical protein B2J96_03405 [Mycobacterium shigaense]BAX92017.1 hypothetical protein MSG_01864 [Mycobacterium shigaense]
MAAIIVLDVFVGIIAVVALIATWNQLRARLNQPGARGVVIAVDQLAPRRKNIARVQVTLRMVGPAVRYEVALDLEADGNRYEASTPKPATRPSMGCDDEEMSWGFEIADDELDSVWVIASWIDARRARLRMAALAMNLSTLETYEWKWAADWRLSAAGHWRRRRVTTTPPRTLPGMGPLELGRPPGRGRLAQVAAETATDADE